MKSKKLIFPAMVALLLSLSFFSFPRPADGCDNTYACNYDGSSVTACDYSCFSVPGASTSTSSTIFVPDDTGLPDPGGIGVILENFANWLLGIFGVVAIIGLVISGFQYILASGSEKVIETAKRNVTYSIIGIIVALSGFVIIRAIDAALNAFSLF